MKYKLLLILALFSGFAVAGSEQSNVTIKDIIINSGAGVHFRTV